MGPACAAFATRKLGGGSWGGLLLDSVGGAVPLIRHLPGRRSGCHEGQPSRGCPGGSSPLSRPLIPNGEITVKATSTRLRPQNLIFFQTICQSKIYRKSITSKTFPKSQKSDPRAPNVRFFMDFGSILKPSSMNFSRFFENRQKHDSMEKTMKNQ